MITKMLFRRKRKLDIHQHNIPNTVTHKKFHFPQLRLIIILSALLTILATTGFIWFINTFSPYTIWHVQNFDIPAGSTVYLFFLIIPLFLFKTITNRYIHGCCVGLFFIGIHLLKINVLLQPFLILLLLLFLGAIEFAFWQWRKSGKDEV